MVLVLGTPVTQAATNPNAFASVGNYETARRIFREPAEALIKEYAARVTRIGFAPVLLAPVPDPIRGNEILHDLLPAIDIDPTNSEDLLWQINRPRPSKVIDRRINRLSKWNVIQARVMTIQVSGEADVTSAATPARSAVRVELDINTQVSDVPLPTDSLSDIFNELWNNANEIAEKGDIQ